MIRTSDILEEIIFSLWIYWPDHKLNLFWHSVNKARASIKVIHPQVAGNINL